MGGTAKRGPKTAAGRARMRLNPIKHGVLSQTPVIPLVEDESEWERLRSGVCSYFDTAGMVEDVFADIIAMLMWRRCRLVRFETETIARYLEEVPADYRRRRMAEGATPEELTEDAVEEMDRMMSARLIPGTETAEKIMRYETRLHRFLLQTIHQLLVLQELRRSRRGSASLRAPHDGGVEFAVPGSSLKKLPERDDNWGRTFPSRIKGLGTAVGRGERAGVEDVEGDQGEAGGATGAEAGVLRADIVGRPNRAERRRRSRREHAGGRPGGRGGGASPVE